MGTYKCKVCGSLKLHKALDFGDMPNANGLVAKEHLNDVVSYPLIYYWCEECTFFQQAKLVNKENLWSDYTFQTGVSKPSVEHFKKAADGLSKKLQNKDFAVVIASNDGTEISLLKKAGFSKVVGVEPAKNIAKIANENGLFTIVDFFGENLSREIVQKYGKADLVIANNVFAHIPDPRDFMMGMRNLISDEGEIYIEVHWLKSLVTNLQIESLYAEHYYVWSLRSIKRLADACGLKISGVRYLPEQYEGSINVVFSKTKENKEVIEEFLEQEDKFGLGDKEVMLGLQKRAEARKKKFVGLIRALKKKGKRISVWTAPAKVSTLLNFFGLSNLEIDYIYDSTPTKIGKFIPKANIPIKDENLIKEDMPDYLIIGARNYLEFAKVKLKPYTDRGVKLIDTLACEIIR